MKIRATVPPDRAAAHEPAGTGRRSLQEPRVEAEAGGMDQASAPDPLSRVSLGCLAAQPAPAPLQLQAPGAGTRSSPPAGVLSRCTGHAGLER